MATGVLGITPERRGLAQDSRKGIPQSSARDQARGSAAMNRVWDYIGFAFWFAGLGYIVLWLFGSPEHLTLPPALRVIGVASAMFVPVRLLLRAVIRRRHAAGVRDSRAETRCRAAAAAAQAGVYASPGQAAQPFRPARHAGLNAHDPEKWAPVFGKDHAQAK